MANPRGISKTPKKPQRNRTESDVRRSFAENLNIDDFPTGNAQNLPRQDHFRKIGSSQAEKEIERLLGHSVPSGPKLPGILRAGVGHKLPARYKKYIEGLFRQGEISEPVARYYLEYFPQGDSLDVPGQSGRASVLRSILREDAKTTRSGWMPIHRLGEGGQGSVILWEKPRENGPPLRLATKDSATTFFWRDYCAEANLTRRLNDLGCRNVISVVEWAFLEEKQWMGKDGKLVRSEPKHRICYEYAEHGDLWNLTDFYWACKLILPEAFIWHLLSSLANALVYCRHGGIKPNSNVAWDTIVHMDIKGGNILFAAPDVDANQLYPCVKLADFGLAYTIGEVVPEVQHFKSTYLGTGTQGYRAPEVEDRSFERPPFAQRAPHQLQGPHSDIYSLGATIRLIFRLLEEHEPMLPQFSHIPGGQRYKDAARQNLFMFYSPELRKLLTACMAPDPRNRPETYHLFREAKRHAEEWGIRAQREGEEAFRRGASGCFHSKVLYTKKHQNRYESDPVFRAGYRKANLRPLYRHLERQPAPPVPPVVPPPPEPPGAADYEHIDVAEMPPKPVRREQQQRGGIRPEMERKIAKKSKEDRKKKGRRMGFLRTALSRFGFA